MVRARVLGTRAAMPARAALTTRDVIRESSTR